MCDIQDDNSRAGKGARTVPLADAVGMVLAHDITEIRSREFKGRAFRKGHLITQEDIGHLRRLGKEQLYVLHMEDDEMHEDDAAYALARALMGEGVAAAGEPKEGRIDIIAARDGLLKVDKESLARFNMLGEVMCATLHDNTRVERGRVVAGTRAVPLVVKRKVVEEAAAIASSARGITLPNPPLAKGGRGGVIEVKELRKPKVGVVITGNEVYYGRVRDAFAPVLERKIGEFSGEVLGMYYAPDDESLIEARLRELLAAGADLLITTGGMSVDPDDVTRFAIRRLGASEIAYGSPVLPGSMFLVAYLKNSGQLSPVPIMGIPACGMYNKITVFDLIFPRVLAGETVGREELAELGHGGLCMNCRECRYPACPFGK
ncbi:MAG TPA: molybdopterin-binding protein [Dissulfurispiraceae bacterium]